MKIDDFYIDQCFITSSLHLKRAVLCGIKCVGIKPAGADPTKEPAKVSFARLNPDNKEDFDLRADINGEVNLGNWVFCDDLYRKIVKVGCYESMLKEWNHRISVLMKEKEELENWSPQ